MYKPVSKSVIQLRISQLLA